MVIFTVFISFPTESVLLSLFETIFLTRIPTTVLLSTKWFINASLVGKWKFGGEESTGGGNLPVGKNLRVGKLGKTYGKKYFPAGTLHKKKRQTNGQ